MADRDLSALHRPVALVEAYQSIGEGIACRIGIGRERQRAKRRSAEMRALHTQEAEFIDRVEHAKGMVELDAVEDDRVVREADVLGTKVPMSFHDVLRPGPQQDGVAP